MAVTVDVYGSCVTRDLFRYTAPGKYRLKKCITEIPVSTLYEKTFSFPEEQVEKMEMDDYEKVLFQLQAAKILPQLLKKEKSDILVIDLADELMERCKIRSGTSMTDQQLAQLYGREVIYDRFFEENEEYSLEKRFSPLELDIWIMEKKYRKFASELLYVASNPEGYRVEQIVVIEALYASDILGLDGRLRGHDKNYRIKESNEWLKKIYQMFYSVFPGCHVIKLPEFVHSSETHLGGVHPLHYMSANYRYMERALDVIMQYSNENTLENLQKEQSLENKILTRAVNSALVYKLNHQIHDLQEKIKSLENMIQP